MTSIRWENRCVLPRHAICGVPLPYGEHEPRWSRSTVLEATRANPPSAEYRTRC
jgi:hypothetical protein